MTRNVIERPTPHVRHLELHRIDRAMAKTARAKQTPKRDDPEAGRPGHERRGLCVLKGSKTSGEAPDEAHAFHRAGRDGFACSSRASPIASVWPGGRR